MKSIIDFLAGFIILSCVSFVSILYAQVPDDPFDGHYSIAKSSEAFLFQRSKNDGVSAQNYDFNIKNYVVVPWDKITDPGNYPWACIDATTADLNGDSDDEIIMVLNSRAGNTSRNTSTSAQILTAVFLNPCLLAPMDLQACWS